MTEHTEHSAGGVYSVKGREFTRDSRYIGPVALDQVLSRAWLRVWPLEKVGFLDVP